MQRVLGRFAAGAVATVLAATTMAGVTTAAVIAGDGGTAHAVSPQGTSVLALTSFVVAGSGSSVPAGAPSSHQKPSHGPHGSQSPSPSPSSTPSPAPTPSGTPYSGTGYDVSWPNCGTNPAVEETYGLVGVTDGRAFTDNPCLLSEYQWAKSNATGMPPSLYLNLNAPIGSTAKGNTSGPVTCTSNHDTLCQSYNYGWNAAQAAYDDASATLAAISGATVDTYWWLDVETGNSWSTSTAANAQVVQGALDYLTRAYSTSGPHVGVYSAPGMWSSIVGSNPVTIGGSANSVPEWLAGASSCPMTTFTGGPVWLVQYNGGSGIDADYAC